MNNAGWIIEDVILYLSFFPVKKNPSMLRASTSKDQIYKLQIKITTMNGNK